MSKIDKVTQVIDGVLAGSQDPALDINGDGKVNMDDVTAVIDDLLNGGDDDNVIDVNGVRFRMVPVEGGLFLMGAPYTEVGHYDNECPQHEVTVGGFSIAETQVTQELWAAVMGSNPSDNRQYGDYPVENISWNDCQVFLSKLNEMTGKNFRLPTEAEWEYAAGGGKYGHGYRYAGSNTLASIAWFAANAIGTMPVAMLEPNELGLYDMTGNVNEWTATAFSRYDNDHVYPYMVYKGGGWNNGAKESRIHYRPMREKGYKSSSLGLRLAL